MGTRLRALREVGRGLAALVALVVLLAGVPAGLWHLAGWPLPHSLPHWSELSHALGRSDLPDAVLIKGTAVVCWIAWAVLAVCVAVEATAFAAGRAAARLPVVGPVQVWAGRLVASALLLFSSLGGLVRQASASPVPQAHALTLAAAALVDETMPLVVLHPATIDPLSTAGAPQSAVGAPTAPKRYVVHPPEGRNRDTLWGIAQRHLGDAQRWPEIFELNQGRLSAGHRLTNPHWIYPGEELLLPADAVDVEMASPTPSIHTPPEGTAAPADAALGRADTGATASALPPLDTTRPTTVDGPATTQVANGNGAAAGNPDSAPTTTPATTALVPQNNGPAVAHSAGRARKSGTEARRPTRRGPSTRVAPRHAPSPIRLPSGSVVAAALAIGVGSAVAMARLRRRRRWEPAEPGAPLGALPLLAEPVGHLYRARPEDAVDDPSADATTSATGRLPFGRVDGDELVVDLVSDGGLALTGPGGMDVARAALLTGLAARAPSDIELLIVGCDVADVLSDRLERLSQVTVVDDLDSALRHLEIDLVRRHRLLDELGASGAGELAAKRPEERLSVIVIVASTVAPTQIERFRAVLQAGRTVAIGALLLGDGAVDTTVHVDETSTVITAGTPEAAARWERADLYRITAAEATDVVDVLIAAQSDADPAAPEAEPMPAEPLPTPTSPPGSDPAITVRLLGQGRIDIAGREVTTGLRDKARELFAYLVLHPDGVTVEAAIEMLWPDAEPRRGAERFRTVLANLRTTLRVGLSDIGEEFDVVMRVRDRCRVDTTWIDCDVWRFTTAMADASTADGPDAVAALTSAADAYSGDLLADTYYEWAEPTREELRHRALDGMARLAELQEQVGNLEASLATLERAITVDAFAEELYRRLMLVQGRLRRPHAVRNTYQRLQLQLGDLDVDVEPATEAALRQALHPSRLERLRAVSEP